MNKSQKKSLKLISIWATAVAPFILGSIFLYLLLPEHKTPETPKLVSKSAEAPKAKSNTPQKTTTAPKIQAQQAPVDQADKNLESLFVKKPLIKNQPKIAIIIDDVGHQWPSSKRCAELVGNFTLSILPDSPFAAQAADLGNSYGKEIMLHAPMEPISHKAWQGGLDQSMDEVQIKNMLTNMLDKVPLAIGINNHMGSAFTQNYQAMNWVMEAIGQRGLYFVDSRTSPMSKGLKAAQNYAIPALKRDVFLDNSRDAQAIQIQLNKLIKRAQQRGQALGIGHPYPETLDALSKLGPLLEAEGISLVAVSQLLEHQKTLVLNPSTKTELEKL